MPGKPHVNINTSSSIPVKKSIEKPLSTKSTSIPLTYVQQMRNVLETPNPSQEEQNSNDFTIENFTKIFQEIREIRKEIKELRKSKEDASVSCSVQEEPLNDPETPPYEFTPTLEEGELPTDLDDDETKRALMIQGRNCCFPGCNSTQNMRITSECHLFESGLHTEYEKVEFIKTASKEVKQQESSCKDYKVYCEEHMPEFICYHCGGGYVCPDCQPYSTSQYCSSCEAKKCVDCQDEDWYGCIGCHSEFCPDCWDTTCEKCEAGNCINCNPHEHKDDDNEEDEQETPTTPTYDPTN